MIPYSMVPWYSMVPYSMVSWYLVVPWPASHQRCATTGCASSASRYLPCRVPPYHCRCVVGMMQWTLGFWVPLAMSAALESRAHRQWEQSQAPQAGQRLRTQPGHGGTGPWPQLGQRLQLAFYRRVHAIMDSRDLVWAGLGLTVLLQTWTALALLTPE